jgi:hypothetical protein
MVGLALPGEPARGQLPLDDEIRMVPMKAEEIQALFGLLGMDRSLLSMRWITRDLLSAAFGESKGDGSDAVAREFTEAFAPERIRADMLRRIRPPEQSERDERFAERFMDATLARKARSADDPERGSSSGAELAEYAKTIDAKRLAPAYVDAIVQLDSLERRSHRNTLLWAAPAASLVRGLRAALRDPPSVDGLPDLMQDMGRDRANQIHQQTLEELIETFEGRLTAEELFDLNQELAKPRYQDFVLAMQTALSESLAAASEDFAVRMLAWAEGLSRGDQGTSARADGARFAKGKGADACVDEALRHDAKCGDLGCNLRQGLFLSACLPAANDGAKLCAGTPGGFDPVAVQGWAADRCNERSRRDAACRAHFERVQQFCRSR